VHDIVKFTEGNTDPLEHYFGRTSTFSGKIMSQFGILSQKAARDHILKIRMRCDEADGWTNVVIPRNRTFLIYTNKINKAF
jgi:hypothetical protein